MAHWADSSVLPFQVITTNREYAAIDYSAQASSITITCTPGSPNALFDVLPLGKQGICMSESELSKDLSSLDSVLGTYFNVKVIMSAGEKSF